MTGPDTHMHTCAHMHALEHKQVGDLIGRRELCVLYVTPYPSHRWLGKDMRCCGNTKQRAGTTFGAMMWGDCQWWRLIHVWLPLCNWGREGWRERTEGVWGESWTFSVSCCNLCVTLQCCPYTESVVAAQNHNINVDHWPLILYFFCFWKWRKSYFTVELRTAHWFGSVHPSPPLLSLSHEHINNRPVCEELLRCTLWTKTWFGGKIVVGLSP